MPVTKAITSILLVGIAFFNTAYAAETATSWGQITSLTSDRNQERLQITTTTDFHKPPKSFREVFRVVREAIETK